MAGSTSIFLKVCPACADQVPTDANRCACGHDFDSNIGAPEESTLRDEELYENYLVARAEQARQSAEAADLAARENPDEQGLLAEAELAREVARSIEADLNEQRNKVKALRRLVELKNRKAVAAEPVVAKPEPVPAVARPTVESRPATSRSRKAARPAPAPEPEEILIVDVPAEPAQPEPVVSAPVVSPAASAEKAAQVLSAIKKAKVREEETRARKAREEEQREREMAEQERAARAEREAQAAAKAIEITTEPSEFFRHEQSARADMAMASIRREDRKDCPNCTARVPLNTTRCSCGFAFVTGGNDLPSLTLCTGDFTALRNSLNLNLRRS